MLRGEIRARALFIASWKFALLYFPWSPQGAAWFSPGMLAVLEHLHPVDKNMFHSHRVLMRFLKGRAIGNRRRIEDNDVGKHTLLDKAAMIEPEIGRRLSAQSPDRFRQRNYFFVTHIFAENSRKVSIGARMGVRF